MNKVILVGRTTTEIELNTTQTGKKYIKFTIACDNGKDEQGNKRDADFVECVAWESRAESIAKYVKKGNRFMVVGNFKTDKYEISNGEKRYRSYVLVKEFEFLESKKDEFVPCEPTSLENGTNSQDNDPFADFGATVQIDDNFLE